MSAWAVAALAVAGAQESPEPIGPARLMRVGPGARQFLYKDDPPGCPAPVARCRGRAYLVAGDPVIASGPSRGGFVAVAFTSLGGRTTRGWLPEARLRPAPVPPPSVAGWTGRWSTDERHITIARSETGRLGVEGDATWGARDPERMKRGGVNTGRFSAEIDGRRGEAAFATDGDGTLPVDAPSAFCRVRMRLVGPYLLVSDNLGCGGMNVTFRGVYRREE